MHVNLVQHGLSVSGQDSYLSLYLKPDHDKRLTALTDDEQVTRLS